LINLAGLLKCLGEMGIASLMVEGGARVITSMLQERLVNYLVMTLVPVFVGGLHALESPLFENHGTPPPRDTTGLPRLVDPSYITFGEDLVITGWLE
jgi:riboflavin biosynthesis pyrimidine reductase